MSSRGRPTFAELEQALAANRQAVQVYLQATKHDLCHDQRVILAQHFALDAGNPQYPMSFEEFASGCDAHQLQQYGICRTQVLEAELRAAQAALKDLQDKLQEATMAACGLPIQRQDSAFVFGIQKLKQDHDHLQQFKDYVHRRLDALEIPQCLGEDCRIGARLNVVQTLVERARQVPTQHGAAPT
jgi:hypothetical protein